MSGFDHVRFEVEGNVGIITLDRPRAANAQSEKVLVELDQAWSAADADRDGARQVHRGRADAVLAGLDSMKDKNR